MIGRAAALVAMMTLLAGCSGGETAPPTSNPPEPATDGGAPAQTGNTSADIESTPSLTPISFDGKIDNFALVCEMSTVGTCVGTPTNTGAAMWTQEIDGRPHAFTVEMTWDAPSPATETLGLTALACWEADNSTTCGKVDGVQGTSPLVLDVPETGLPDDATLFLGAYVPSMLPPSPAPGVVVYHQIEQAFQLEGSVSVLTST